MPTRTLRSVVSLVVSLPLSLLLTAVPSLAAPPRERPALSQLSPEDFATFAKAVETMKGRELLDPTSWLYQANVHHVPSCQHNGAALPGCVENPHDRKTWPKEGALTWAVCPHGDLMFLSWHRLYLFYMEKLLQQASGDKDFRIPYWDYSQDADSRRELPAALRDPSGSKNPLFVDARGSQKCHLTGRGYDLVEINSGKPVDRRATRIEQAMSQTIWLRFSNEIETLPHNQMHVSLGGFLDRCAQKFECKTGDRCGWMASPSTAGRDPVFWLHHANIDRLWSLWSKLPGRRNPLVDDVLREAWDACGANCGTKPSYLRQMCSLRGHQTLEKCRDAKVFTFFDVTSDGKPTQVDLSPRELVQTSFKPTGETLGYFYTDEEAAGGPLVATLDAPAEGRPTQLGDQPRKISLTVNAADRGKVREVLRSLVDDEPEQEAILLRISDIHTTGSGTPVGTYEIYLNLPAGARLDDASLSATNEDHYIGSLSFFGLIGTEGHHALNFLADITANVLAQKARGTWNDAMEITFVPVGPHPEKPAIEIGSIELVFQ